MGRLEKQIIIAALALVGVLLTVVVLKGLKPRDGADTTLASNAWDNTMDERPRLDVTPGPGTSESIDFGPKTAPPSEAVGEAGAGQAAAAVIRPNDEPIASPAVLPIPPVQKDPEPTPPSSDKPWTYVVKDGEVLSMIAQRELGSVRHMDAILDLNPGLNADRLDKDDPILMPALSTLKERKTRNSGRKVDLAGKKTHVVKPGESLWVIAMKYYGSNDGVKTIVDANGDLLKSEDTVLRIGWELVIPE